MIFHIHTTYEMALCYRLMLLLSLVALALGAVLPQNAFKDKNIPLNTWLNTTEISPKRETTFYQGETSTTNQFHHRAGLTAMSQTGLKQPDEGVKTPNNKQLKFNSEMNGEDHSPEESGRSQHNRSRGHGSSHMNDDVRDTAISRTDFEDDVNSEHSQKYFADGSNVRNESGISSLDVQTSHLNSQVDKPTADAEDMDKTRVMPDEILESHISDDQSYPRESSGRGLYQFTEFLSRVKASDVPMIKSGCCSLIPKFDMANCSYCNLSVVPTDLPTDLKILLLSYNNITSEALTFGALGNFSNLTHLWLDSNSLTFLPDDAFEGLENLVILNLYDNNIDLDESLQTSSVFHPLNDTLETLIINRNVNDISKRKCLVYPDLALSGLRKLTWLFIDGLKATEFGQGFQRMKSLRNLTLSGYDEGYCDMVSMSNKTFSFLSQLHHLNLSDCNLNGSRIETGVFRPLIRLESLDVSNNFRLGIQTLGDIMFGMRNNPHFRYLRLQRIGERFAPCIIVYKYTLRYFKNTGLEVIEAMDNDIEDIEEGAIQMLPTTLRTLNLTNNKIAFGAYWRDMASLSGLQSLHLDGYRIPEEFPQSFPSKDLHCPLSPKPAENTTEINFEENAEVGKKCICGEDTCSNTELFALPLPPNLQQFTMHSNALAYKANNIRFCRNNELKYADLSGNMFSKLIGPIWGLEKLQYLNLSCCLTEYIGDDFFDHFQALEGLNLFQNLLGDRLNADLGGLIFNNLYNMKHLNISFNNIYRLNKPAFQDLLNLETLDLSVNRLSHFNFTISHMTKLRLLDLHKNDITSIPKVARDHIESLISSNQVKVDMRQNPIYCDCDNLDFLEWVVKTKVFGSNFTTYYCKYPTENQPAVEMKNGYDEEVSKLRRQCITNVGIFLSVLGATLLMVVIIIGLLLYRFRWTVRYWYHAAKLRISSKEQQQSEDEYEYDVFISYAKEDVDFVLKEISPQLGAERRLKLMVHGEKFQVGRHITDNIYMAVRQCRKTLVVVTESMIKSHWCTYELQMARMESISTGRNVLVFLLLEEIPASLMNIDVLSYIKTSTYIAYPDNHQHRQAFWDKLAHDLRER